ncbi:MAG: type II toxin-antitoxin system Phd/YefM family antitoxin [Campylobacteraceae bacterium]|jgi:PHD/YefM family antitoxin component YafN of YafNO toxin-antitoxin module|nr:type II toxin-antitoxin system Phd/YefM family antitoxin [Campylobacteraceae bacterium]
MAAFYDKDEIFTATEFARDFSSILKKVNSHEIERAVVVKNSHFRAVLVDFKEYEKLKDALGVLEKIYMKNRNRA